MGVCGFYSFCFEKRFFQTSHQKHQETLGAGNVPSLLCKSVNIESSENENLKTITTINFFLKTKEIENSFHALKLRKWSSASGISII